MLCAGKHGAGGGRRGEAAVEGVVVAGQGAAAGGGGGRVVKRAGGLAGGSRGGLGECGACKILAVGFQFMRYYAPQKVAYIIIFKSLLRLIIQFLPKNRGYFFILINGGIIRLIAKKKNNIAIKLPPVGFVMK